MLIVLIPLIALVLIAVVTAVVKLFVRWEREGKEHLVPLVLLGMLVVEATIYPDPNAVPRGLFHPGSGATQLRLPEIYITLALIARLIARGRPDRIGLPAGLWLAFCAWMVVGAVEGKLYGNGLSQDLYEAKDIFYIVGAYALAAGVPIRKYIDTGALYKLGTLCVVCASVIDLMTLGGVKREHEPAAAPAAVVRNGRRGDGGPVPRRRGHVLPGQAGLRTGPAHPRPRPRSRRRQRAAGRSARGAGQPRLGRVGGGRGDHRRAAARDCPTVSTSRAVRWS